MIGSQLQKGLYCCFEVLEPDHPPITLLPPLADLSNLQERDRHPGLVWISDQAERRSVLNAVHMLLVDTTILLTLLVLNMLVVMCKLLSSNVVLVLHILLLVGGHERLTSSCWIFKKLATRFDPTAVVPVD